ncbi:hypothetical protein Pars_0909 [Pyrobaculum arsenaticum DSM 13514]|uniref:Uncharacterized protein n=2 Tax=Thermoproteaceae TaxID=2267 RepID=A4WJC3_PYRAR|nr:hypothetical protein Pars_0909 [Pyrobaculum arsenaticum DSM 13514]
MQFRTIPPKTLNFFLAYQTEEESYFFIPEYNLYIFSKLYKNEYNLAFVLNKKIKIDKFCKDIEEKSSVLLKKKDIPWRGFETDFLLTLTPIDCEKNIVVPTLRVNINSGDTIFHWDQIAKIIFSDELFNYLEWIREKYRINYEILDT